MDEAEIVVPDRAALGAGAAALVVIAPALSLEDAVDGIAVEMRQEVRDDEGQIIEGKAGGLAQGADDGALFLGGLPGQLMRPTAVILTVLSSSARAICGSSRC